MSRDSRDTHSIVELRQYTLRPGRRDDLISLFEERFIEVQEALGMGILGQFRDAADPDRFVWLRGYADMASRRRALEGFYDDSPVWREHRTAANDTLVDSDNVLLLRPARPGSGVRVNPADRPARDAPEQAGRVIAAICSFDAPVTGEVAGSIDEVAAAALRAAGGTPLGCYVTEPSKNDFRHPVREGENVLVWLGSAPDDMASSALRAVRELTSRLAVPVEILELVPTRRSLLPHRAHPS